MVTLQEEENGFLTLKDSFGKKLNSPNFPLIQSNSGAKFSFFRTGAMWLNQLTNTKKSIVTQNLSEGSVGLSVWL